MDFIGVSRLIVGVLELLGVFTFYCKPSNFSSELKHLLNKYTNVYNSYNAIKSHMSNVGEIQMDLNAGQHIMAACEAGIMTLVLTNPIWVVKTRLCLQYGGMSENAVQPTKRYRGMVDALAKIYRFEGIRGLYRGFVPGIFGVSHGALQFMAYEELKRYYIEHYGLRREERLGTLAYLGCAATSKLFAAVITYPYQVVRARLQDQYANYNGVMDVIRRTWRYVCA